MNPFFFGASERPLFGFYQPPRTTRGRATGVVLCYPMGQEYMRAHRAFRQLAMLLTKAGFHVLRFDYFGTGDSAGASDEGTVTQWIEDARAAVDEVKAMAGVRRVVLVGSRLGATLAALAAAGRGDVDAVVLWDPVVDGAAHVVELVEGAGPALAGASTGPRPSETVGVLGFPLAPALRAELATVDLTGLQLSPATRVHIVVSEERADCRALTDALSPRCARATYQCVNTPCDWNEVDNYGSSLIPQAIIQAIVAHLGEEAS